MITVGHIFCHHIKDRLCAGKSAASCNFFKCELRRLLIVGLWAFLVVFGHPAMCSTSVSVDHS